ncbi:hypothetical protein HQ520_13040, partial [bacterium]|nr:hypothetical protein [bacterium]
LKTVLDWAPRLPGRHVESWDGMDASGLVHVPDLSGYNLLFEAYTLPDNAILVTGSPAPAATTISDQKAVKSPASAADLERRRAVRSALVRQESPVAPEALLTLEGRATPGFAIDLLEIAAEGAIRPASADSVGVTGEIGIRVALDDATRQLLQQQRYEIITYVDYQLVSEQEQGYSPFTSVLDTTRFSEGEHVITINVAGMQDQLDARSLIVNIRK